MTNRFSLETIVMEDETAMTDNALNVEWTAKPLFAPFSWHEGRDVLVPIDIFAPNISEELQDKIFAVMALCPQHQFRLVTDFPDKFAAYVRKITEDHGEWLTWRVQAGFVLQDIGRGARPRDTVRYGR